MSRQFPIIFSLTSAGEQLAQRIAAVEKNTQSHHRPGAFTATVQQYFQAGHPLIMICATGIAVRTLAAVLKDKYQDPPVLVLDEQGQFVIPLLSGHEGGANEWARQLADKLGAQHVLTSNANFTHPQYIIGMGCERDVPVEYLQTLLAEGLSKVSLNNKDLTALASIELKSDEINLLALADQLKLETHFYPAETLSTYDEQLTQHSDIVFRETGCYGVAEAAALACAEQLTDTHAELILPKIKNTKATLAIARAYPKNKDYK